MANNNEEYRPEIIEPKWQKCWEDNNFYRAQDGAAAGGKKKTYLLVEFPYPSGEGLHVGHLRSYSAMDVVARKRRMEGFNVLYPIGWDAFGLPTENFAIKTGQHPKHRYAEKYRQFPPPAEKSGFSFDWSREINTTDPAYYKWTQWIFLQLWEKGLAYKTRCRSIGARHARSAWRTKKSLTAIANVAATPVTRRELKAMDVGITKYADRLIEDLDNVDYWKKSKSSKKSGLAAAMARRSIFISRAVIVRSVFLQPASIPFLA